METLKRFSTTPERLAELNHLKMTTKLKGKNLLVPIQTAVPTTPPAAPETPVATAAAAGAEVNSYYTVKKGDTLSALAKKFRVTTAILSAWNNLTEKVALRPGKRLIVAKSPVKDNG